MKNACGDWGNGGARGSSYRSSSSESHTAVPAPLPPLAAVPGLGAERCRHPGAAECLRSPCPPPWWAPLGWLLSSCHSLLPPGQICKAGGGLGGGHPLGDPSCACLSPWRNLHTSEGGSGPFPSLAVGFGGCVPKQCQHHKDLIPSECFASCADQDPSASPAAAHQRLLARSRPPNQAGAGSVPRVPSVTASVPWDRWQGAARGQEGKKIPADVRASPSWWTAKNQHCGLGFLTPLRASRAFAKA